MPDFTERLTRYFLARLRRAAIHDIYEQAAVAGLIESVFLDKQDQTGLVWRVDPGSSFGSSGDMQVDRTCIARMLHKVPAHNKVLDDDVDLDEDQAASMPTAGKHGKPQDARPLAAVVIASGDRRPRKTRPLGRDAMLRLLRTLVPPPSPSDAAVVLSLAHAVGLSVDSLEHLLALLRRRDPMIVVSVPLNGFEGRLGKLLERGRIIPRVPPQQDGFGNYALSGRYKSVPDGLPRLVTFSGTTLLKSADNVVQRAIAKALAGRDTPVLLAHHGQDRLSQKIKAAADLVLELDRIDRPLLARILEASTSFPAVKFLTSMKRLGLNTAAIGLDELVLAVRPNRTVDEIVANLKVLGDGDGCQSDGGEEEGEADKKPKDRKKLGKSKSSSKDSVHFEITLPHVTEKAVDAELTAGRSVPVPLVETLPGYGDATGWAMDLKADLALWRQKSIAWSETSSRLLLHGPPGTGKTTFARALCNSLGIPMIATSVGRWLEPGYLGDVLQTMSAAFETARTHAPSILFIDEIDNIGRRGGTGQNGDYWDSLVNRMLELLDGTAKLEGVIVVGATNIPERIDEALLRSGRLERQIELHMPDTDTLTGILRFHLGSDVEGVISSRPAPGLMEATPPPPPLRQADLPPPADPKPQSKRRQPLGDTM
jgi:cell division protease FtsH